MSADTAPTATIHGFEVKLESINPGEMVTDVVVITRVMDLTRNREMVTVNSTEQTYPLMQTALCMSAAEFTQEPDDED